jgi:hypothetical protein
MSVVVAALAGAPGRAEPGWQGMTLKACDDEDGYPPFTIHEADGKATGYSVDLMNEALAGTGLGFSISFLPTRRCTLAINSGAMHMSMEDMWNPDYAAHRLVTAPIYVGLYGLYYDRTRFPRGLSSEDVIAHPERHPGCGTLGEDYLEFAPGQLDTNAHWIGDALDRIVAGKCQFYPDIIELGGAYRWRGRPIFADPRFGFAVMHLPPGTKVPPEYLTGDRQSLYFYIRADFPSGPALIERIDQTVKRWQSTGRDVEVLSRYVDLKLLSAAVTGGTMPPLDRPGP